MSRPFTPTWGTRTDLPGAFRVVDLFRAADVTQEQAEVLRDLSSALPSGLRDRMAELRAEPDWHDAEFAVRLDGQKLIAYRFRPEPNQGNGQK